MRLRFGGWNGLIAFISISMEKFSLSYEQIEVRARSRNELKSYAKVPLYFITNKIKGTFLSRLL